MGNRQLGFGGNQLGSAAINISNHDVASSERQDRYNRKGWLGGMSQVAEGGEGSRGGNISQRRLVAFPFRYTSPYLWASMIKLIWGFHSFLKMCLCDSLDIFAVF